MAAVGGLLYQAATTPEARQAELRETRDLPARLAYALARAPGARHGPLQGAVMALERNRARWLSEALALVGDKPQDVPEQAWQTFLAHRETLQRFGPCPEHRRSFRPVRLALEAAGASA